MGESLRAWGMGLLITGGVVWALACMVAASPARHGGDAEVVVGAIGGAATAIVGAILFAAGYIVAAVLALRPPEQPPVAEPSRPATTLKRQCILR